MLFSAESRPVKRLAIQDSDLALDMILFPILKAVLRSVATGFFFLKSATSKSNCIEGLKAILRLAQSEEPRQANGLLASVVKWMRKQHRPTLKPLVLTLGCSRLQNFPTAKK